MDAERRRGEDGRLGARAGEREQADPVRERPRPQLLRVQHADGAHRRLQLLVRLRRRRLHMPGMDSLIKFNLFELGFQPVFIKSEQILH